MEVHNIRKVVIVDDDMDDYMLVKEAMLKVDPAIEVEFIDNCDRAASYSGEDVDLLLLDINMPKYDGFFWLKSIRNKGYSELPIVMYTNSLSPTHMRKAYIDGANLYFAKPDSFNQLISGLKKIVQMDWSRPDEIKGQYTANGQFSRFLTD